MSVLLAVGVRLQGDAIPGLIKHLHSESAEVRSAAAKKLKSIGDPAVSELKKAALDADPDVSNSAKLP